MKWTIIYLLIGILITTIGVKLMLDDESSNKKISGYFQKSASAVIVALMVAAAFWPLMLIYAIGGRHENKPK